MVHHWFLEEYIHSNPLVFKKCMKEEGYIIGFLERVQSQSLIFVLEGAQQFPSGMRHFYQEKVQGTTAIAGVPCVIWRPAVILIP